MKTGRTIQELAAEVKRQSETKIDLIADTRCVGVKPIDNGLTLSLEGHGDFEVGDIAHGQIADHTKIPSGYYNKMRNEDPDLLATNVDRWFKKYPVPRMLRMLDGKNRALLSDSYRPLDNYDFCKVIFDACSRQNLEILSCEVTEKRLYLKAVDKSEFQVPVGYKMGDGSHKIFDVCCPMFIASNSEVGYGRILLETGVYTRACTNLCWFSDGAMKRTHVGGRHRITEVTGVENIEHLLTSKTRQKSDEVLWLQMRDVLASIFDKRKIERRVEVLAAAAENKIINAAGVVKVVTDRFNLTASEGSSVMDHLIAGGSLTQYGLHAAVTRAAQDAVNYDRATELEYLGGQIVELPRTEWDSLLEAA